MRLLLHIFILVLGICGIQAWTYRNQRLWHRNYTACGRRSQSPIIINTSRARSVNLPHINFHNYNIQHTVLFKNTGYTAEISFPRSVDKPSITGGPLKPRQRYVLENIHFHWGSTNRLGSEHIINGRKHPLEIHLVHRNIKYASMQQALQHRDGLAVIARFLDTQFETEFRALNVIIAKLPEIKNYSTQTFIVNFQADMFVKDLNCRHYYFTYQGSLTTPPCSEVVDWIVFAMPLYVRSAQLLPFRQLLDKRGNRLVNNFRFK